MAGKDKDGYGRFRLGRSKARANRVAWELAFGPIPEGMCVCHTCDNPSCVRPDHLFLGTNQQNTEDRHNKGRSARGESHDHKLTGAEVLEIRSKYQAGVVKQQDLADEYGVSQVLISMITLQKIWKND